MSDKKYTRKSATKIQVVTGYLLQSAVIVRGLILIPFFISILGDRLYGLWLASGGILVWLTMLDMGLARGLMQRMSYYYGKNNLQKHCDYFFNGLLIYGTLGTFLLITGLLVSYPLPSLLNTYGRETEIIRLSFQIAVFSHLLNIVNTVLRGYPNTLLRPLIPMLSMFIWAIIGIISTVYMLLNDFGLISIPFGYIITEGGLVIFNTGYIVKLMYKKGLKIQIIKEIVTDLKQLIPSLFGAKMGQSLVMNIEPTIITIVLNPEVATAYTLTRRAADFVSQGLHTVLGAIIPSFAHLFGTGDHIKTAATVKKIMTVALFGGLIGFGTYIIGNGSFVSLWVGKQYYLGYFMTLLIGIGILSRVIHNFLSDLLIGVGKIKYSSYLNLSEAIVRLILIYLLINYLGISGVPIGMFISCCIFGIILGKKLYNVFYHNMVFPSIGDMSIPFVFTAILIIINQKIFFLWESWLSFIPFVFSITILIFFSSLFSKYFRILIKEIVG